MESIIREFIMMNFAAKRGKIEGVSSKQESPSLFDFGPHFSSIAIRVFTPEAKGCTATLPLP